MAEGKRKQQCGGQFLSQSQHPGESFESQVTDGRSFSSKGSKLYPEAAYDENLGLSLGEAQNLALIPVTHSVISLLF